MIRPDRHAASATHLPTRQTAIELWRQTWQAAYPHLDFTARLDWWRDRWRTELVPVATIVVAERSDGLVGFVTVDPVERLSRSDRGRARGMARKYRRRLARRGAAYCAGGPRPACECGQCPRHRVLSQARICPSGEDVNARSGAPVLKMSWRPGCLDLRRFELQPRQPRVEPARGGEAVVGAVLDDTPMFQNQNAVALQHGRKAMRDDECRASLHQPR